MDGVEFVTSAPAEAQWSPAVDDSPAKRTRWSREELELVLGDSSAHVRFLLKELSAGADFAPSDLKSKPVSYAQVQRICNSRGREPLVVAGFRNGEKVYALNGDYRDVVAPLVADAAQPPPSEPKPPSERKPRMPRRNANMSALDGIATSGGAVSIAPQPLPPPPARRIAQGQSGRSLLISSSIPIDFCKELLGFVNATANGTRYRIVLEDDGYRLEAC